MSTPKTILYLNVYETDRSYGGPEEGGWWYNTGNPLGSQPFAAEIEAVLGRDKTPAERPGFEMVEMPSEWADHECAMHDKGLPADHEEVRWDGCTCARFVFAFYNVAEVQAERERLLNLYAECGYPRKDLHVGVSPCIGEAYPATRPRYE